jgi:hypothetical protein
MVKTVNELITALQCLVDMGDGDEPVVLVSIGERGRSDFFPVTEVMAPPVVMDDRYARDIGLPGETCIFLGCR